jgi:hypothetical protein
VPIYLEYLGYSVALVPGEIVVGRDITCGLRFNDEAVSRRHMRLTCTGDELYIEDLGSMNGTLLNDKPIEVRTPTRVLNRDAIELGGYRLKVRFVEEEEDQLSTRRMATLLELGNLKRPRRPADPGRFTGSFRTAKPTMRPPERRRHHRQSIELSLVYTSDSLEIEVMTRDLSVSGVFVCTEVLDPVDTECELQILLDGAPPLQVRGIVRRVVDARQDSSEPAGLGIEFIALGEREQSWIESAIQREIMTGPIERIDS